MRNTATASHETVWHLCPEHGFSTGGAVSYSGPLHCSALWLPLGPVTKWLVSRSTGQPL